MSRPESARLNPYVGTRSFDEADSRYFFGRDEERRQLTSLVIAHRVVLFYAQSGAGKTSLLRASVIPELKRRKKVVVLPLTRVGGDLPPGVDRGQVKNIFVFNALVNLAGADADPGALVGLSLREGLEPYLSPGAEERRARPRLLILDQFEELFTSHPERYTERAEFFGQLQECLAAHPQLSLLLTMREDYVARLDYYAAQMPDRLRTRFRMERLPVSGALAAVKGPAEQAGRPFEAGVAESLVDNLCRIQIGGTREGQGAGTALGDYVEPVHLQIVCRQLWEGLPPGGETIRPKDVQSFGDVDQALTGFYEATLRTVVAETGIGQNVLRTWFDVNLITPAGTRGLVYRGQSETGDLPNPAVDILNDAYLIRADVRGGDVWYQLAHDRLVEPVLDSNRTWRETHLSSLQRQAAQWEEEEEGRRSGLLLRDEALVAAAEWAAANQPELTDVERRFLRACHKAQAAAERERRQALRIRWLAVGATIFGILALIAMFYALGQTRRAQTGATAEAEAKGTAIAALETVAASDLMAKDAQREAEAHAYEAATAQAWADQMEATAEAAGAEDLQATASAAQAVADQLAGTAVAASTAAEMARQTAAAQLDTAVKVGLTPEPLAETTASTSTPTSIVRGLSIVRLTSDPAREYVPSFSPDGRYIAYMSDRDGSWQIYLRDLGYGISRRLTTNDADNYHPRFSPDGQQIVFASRMDGDWDLYLMDLAGQLVRQLTDEPGDQYYPSFSPDGQRIVFMSRTDGVWGVVLTDPAGSYARAVIDGSASNAYPVFSPDGLHLVFQSDRDGNWEIYAMDLESRAVRRLTRDPARDADPLVSPDGRWIVFESNRSGNYDIYVMDWNGGQVQQLTNHPAEDLVPAFAPDGSGVIFQSSRDGGMNLYVLPFGAAGQEFIAGAVQTAPPPAATSQEATDSAAAATSQAILEQEERVQATQTAAAVQDMVFIRGGEFLMGSPQNQGNENERPQHLQDVNDFWLDRFEVTNAEYRKCVAAGVCVPPHREDGTPQVASAKPQRVNYHTASRFDQFPVIFVGWQDARTYCEWLGKRLPTEAEWEWAAKGPENYRYPWGDEPEPSDSLANYDNEPVGDTTEVGSYPPTSLGLYDMAGNVWEWTSSLYAPYPYDPLDGREDPDAEGDRVLRGGSWRDGPDNLRTANRDSRRPGGSLDNIGFRCAKSSQ